MSNLYIWWTYPTRERQGMLQQVPEFHLYWTFQPDHCAALAKFKILLDMCHIYWRWAETRVELELVSNFGSRSSPVLGPKLRLGHKVWLRSFLTEKFYWARIFWPKIVFDLKIFVVENFVVENFVVENFVVENYLTEKFLANFFLPDIFSPKNFSRRKLNRSSLRPTFYLPYILSEAFQQSILSDHPTCEKD